MFATNRKKPVYARGKRQRSPLMLIGVTVTVLIALIGVGIFVIRPLVNSHAAAVNQACTLTVPPNPLSAQGLATPYQLTATDPAAGPCNESNPNQAAFVQAVILDPATGKMSAYEPLVVDQGTQPAVAPVVPQLPANAVVGIWFGDNGNALTLLQNHAKAVGQGNPNATANTLFGFLANRLSNMLSVNGLNCVASLNIQNPVTLTTDGNGVVTAATIATKTVPANGNGNGNGGGVQQTATGGATINLDPNAGNAQVALNITYPNHPNQQINVNLAPTSCTGTPVFTQAENTDGNGQNQANTVVNNLQGVQAIPNNWFMTVTDPAQNNAIVGCGAVVANGTTGTVTLGNVTPADGQQGQPVATPTTAP